MATRVDNVEQPLTRSVLCAVKLGGAALTNKDVRGEISEGRLRQAADIIAESWTTLQAHCQGSNRDGTSPLIVVHGAGSCGHFEAKEFGIASGRKEGSHPQQTLGFVRTHASVARLNGRLVNELQSRGIPAIGISPFPLWTTERGGREVSANAQASIVAGLDQVLRFGLLPVIHGDTSLDLDQGCAILSGDVILPFVAQLFAVKDVVFITDVAGVYDRDPKIVGPEPPRLLRSANALDLKALVDGGNWSTVCPVVDVTGGMKSKLESALAAHRAGSKVFICSIDNLQDCLAACRGEAPEGGTTLADTDSSLHKD